MRFSTIARLACAVALMFTTLAACSFEADPADDPVTATLKIHDGTATAKSGDKELSGTELEEALPKDTVVTTGEDSLVELAWSDGSVTRLDSDSSMKAGSGKDRGQLLTGKSWHRVSSEGSGNFDLTLSDGSALTTQGTGFIVDCDSSKQDCSVFLLEGKLTASGTEFSEKTWTTVSGGKAGEVNELTWSDAPGSDFGKKNSDLDGKAKNGKTLEELYKDADPALASMNGSFNGKIKITKAECLEGNCGPRKLPKKGETGDRKYAFKIECEDRLPCAGKSLTTWTEIKSGKE